jgi:hypothetical protein
MVLALDQAARVMPCRHVAEPHVSRQRPEERDSVSDQDRHAGDDDAG